MKNIKFVAACLIYLFLVCVVFLFTVFNFNDSINYTEYNYYAKYINTKVDAIMTSRLASAQAVCDNLFFEKWLSEGAVQAELLEFVDKQKEYVQCSSIDLVTVETETGYNNIDKVVFQMEKGNDRDLWYFDFLDMKKDSSIELYYHSLDGTLYVYYNKKIYDSEMNFIAVAGFLFQYDQILSSITIPAKNDFEVYFTNMSDQIIIHPDQSKINDVTIYDFFGKLQDGIQVDESSYKSSRNNTLYAKNGSYTSVSHLPEWDVKLVIHHMPVMIKPHISAIDFAIAFGIILVLTAVLIGYIRKYS